VNQIVPQCPCVIRIPRRFGQIYWPSAGSHMQRYFNLELSHLFTAVVVFTITKIIKVGL